MAATAAMGVKGATTTLYEELRRRYPEEEITEDDVVRIVKTFASAAGMVELKVNAKAVGASMRNVMGVKRTGHLRFATADMLVKHCGVSMMDAAWVAEYFATELRGAAVHGESDPPSHESSQGAKEGETLSPAAEAAGGDSKSQADSGKTTLSGSVASEALSSALTMLTESQQQQTAIFAKMEAREEQRAAKSVLVGKTITLDVLEQGADGYPTLRGTHKWLQKTVTVALRAAKGLSQALQGLIDSDPSQVDRSDFISKVSKADDEAMYDLVRPALGEIYEQLQEKATEGGTAVESMSGMGLL